MSAQKPIQSSKVYTLKGEFGNIDIDISQYDNHHIFKKITKSKVELAICNILMAHPHENIVKIFEVGTDYVIMECVNIDLTSKSKNDILETMRTVKTYLQNLGIIYIDWKPDNIGIGIDDQLKLFDFDVSGLLDVNKHEWIIAPKPYYAYTHAITNGFNTPNEIDDYAFTEYLFK
jgi:hypothetical protein